MQRRGFVVLLGGAAIWPLVVQAQQRAMPVIGFINGGSATKWAHLVAAYRKGLNETGYVEGQNVAIEYHWADRQWDRLPEMAADLARRQVTVIVSGGGAAFAAKAATTTIPVVFTSGDDPVKSGLVSSLSRPDGNVTGISSFVVPIASKRFDFLRQLTSSTLVGVLVNQINPASRSDLAEVERAAQIQAQQLLVLDASNEREIETAFATLKDRRAGALFVCNDTLFTLSREQIVTLAARYAVPTIYIQREYTEIGGLISYGIDFRDVYRQLGIYTGRILNGAKPADLPILLPTKFELIINLKTAKTLNLDIPPNLLALADEVIE